MAPAAVPNIGRGIRAANRRARPAPAGRRKRGGLSAAETPGVPGMAPAGWSGGRSDEVPGLAPHRIVPERDVSAETGPSAGEGPRVSRETAPADSAAARLPGSPVGSLPCQKKRGTRLRYRR